jgi:hypothetical protein
MRTATASRPAWLRLVDSKERVAAESDLLDHLLLPLLGYSALLLLRLRLLQQQEQLEAARARAKARMDPVAASR